MASAPPPVLSGGGHHTALRRGSVGLTSSLEGKTSVSSTVKKRKSSAPTPSVAPSIPSVSPHPTVASYSTALALYCPKFGYQAATGMLPYPLNQSFVHHPQFYQGVAPPAPVAPPSPPPPPPKIIVAPVARPPSAYFDLTSKVSSQPSAGDSMGVGGGRGQGQ